MFGGTLKSHASDLRELATCILKDAFAKCVAKQPEPLDVKNLRSRVEHEGVSFLTITLPQFAKDFEKALAKGGVDSTLFRSHQKSGAIPAFLRGMTSLVFDKDTGRILDEPQIEAIEGVRQVCLAFKKLEVPCAARRTRAALREFKSIELELSVAIPEADVEDFLAVSDHVWPSVLGDASNANPLTFVPKHGPGATAEKLSGNRKFTAVRWHDRLENYFPLLNTRFCNENAYDSEEFHSISLVNEDEEQPVRVIPVPKTLKAPRIIAIEPVCMQYCQQAIAEFLVKRIEASKLTAGRVNFTDQTVNQRMALSASKGGGFATIDLSSASDRVPYSLAIRMFDRYPDLKGAISATRSTRAQMPDGEVIALRKFASMGSALCFPIEAMYFYTICVKALLELHNLPVESFNIRRMAKLVYVYGDDIIVPEYAATAVIEHLQKYHCKVNTSKSFWTGKFRESCGVDAFDGEVVTPTYIKSVRPYNRREAGGLISWVKTSNLFYQKGYWLTADHMINAVESTLGALPIVGPKCSGLGKVSFQHSVSTERWNKGYQVPEVRTWCAVPVYQNDELAGHAALTKCLLKLERRQSSHVIAEGEHLVKTARHGAVALKRRWVRPY